MGGEDMQTWHSSRPSWASSPAGASGSKPQTYRILRLQGRILGVCCFGAPVRLHDDGKLMVSGPSAVARGLDCHPYLAYGTACSKMV